MTRKTMLIFTICFSVLLLSVGGIQAVVELRKSGTVQMADFFVDTFVTPFRHAKTLHELSSRLSAKLDSLGGELSKARSVASNTADPWEGLQAERFAEEAATLAQDLKKNALNVNRHYLDDSSSVEHRDIEAVRADLDTLLGDVTDRAAPDGVLARHARLAETAKLFPSRYPLLTRTQKLALPAKTFFKYTFFSNKYVRDYENEMEEGSIFANATRPWMRLVRYITMNDVGTKAVNARDEWLFYRTDVDYLARPYILDKRAQAVDFNDVKTEDAIAAIRLFKEQLAAYGIDLLVVIIPGKPSIYPDYLSDQYTSASAGTLSHSLRAMRELKDAGVECVDLFGPFGAERQNDSLTGDKMYLRTDTHWRSRGVRLAARCVADRVRQYPWFSGLTARVDYALDSVTVLRDGDVGVMTKLPDLKIRSLQMRFPQEAATCFQVYRVEKDATGNEVGRRLYQDDFSEDSRILILGDSFSRIYQTDEPRSAGWISHLAYELSQPLSSVISDGGASTLVRETLARKVQKARHEGRRTLLTGKKLVIWEFIERDFRYGAEGWKQVQM